MAQVERIWLKRARMGPMDVCERATLVVDRGLRNNTEQGGKRQVTIISKERWAEAMVALSADVAPSARRANMGLRKALDARWGGGAYGEVIAGGEIAPGDAVAWADQT